MKNYFYIKVNNLIGRLGKYRIGFVIGLNMFSIILANYFSFFLRFDGNIPSETLSLILKTFPYIILIKIFFISFFGLNKGLWRFVSTPDLLDIIKAVSLGEIVSVVFIYLLRFDYPRSVFLIDWLILILIMGGIRFQRRLLREFIQSSESGGKKILLIGAGMAGEMLLREIKQNFKMHYEVVGFIDDDPQKKGSNIQGIPILGTRKNIPSLTQEYEVEEMIIAIPSASSKKMREIMRYCQKTGLKVRTIPGMGDIIDGKVSITQIREVQLEDLLCRDIIHTDFSNIKAYLKGKIVLITGAGGSIGSEICRQVSGFKPENIILFDQNENGLFYINEELKEKFPELSFTPIIGDIKNTERTEEVIKEYKPFIIIHAAAYKHVPMMEANISEAIKNNILGTRTLALLAEKYEVRKFVLISTDKTVNPTSVMGATKKISEFFIQKLGEKSKCAFTIVRFGNVIGSNGSVITVFRRQIEERKSLTVTHPEIKRFFMTIPEAVQLVLQASVMSIGGEVFLLEMGEQIKIADLAKNMISLSNLKFDQDIGIVYTGLRPGEKLYEELYEADEKIEPTKFDKIKKITGNNRFSWNDLNSKINELEQIIVKTENRDRNIINKLKEIIPTYLA